MIPMLFLDFSAWLASEGSAFGLEAPVVEEIRQRTEGGDELLVLARDPRLSASGLRVEHLLPLRRAVWRYHDLVGLAQAVPGAATARSWLEIEARRWATSVAAGDARLAESLAGALQAAAAATLKRGRLRMHLKRPQDPRSADLGELAERTEGCAELPPHRWYRADRAVADGLLWIEVVPPEAELERALGQAATAERVDQLQRAVARPVLAGIARRAEREAISTAALALRSLLARPAIDGAVGGILIEPHRIWASVVGGKRGGGRAEFGTDQIERLQRWLAEAGVVHAGLTRRGAQKAFSEVVRVLSTAGVGWEPIREAGLMKQARRKSGPLKAAAAEVVALRLQDPLAGYADLEPDELGLGEYLDRVEADRLRAALADARQAAAWDRQGARSIDGGLVHGSLANPMVRSAADLRPGLELSGTVVNLTHFGVFVELGLDVQGLVHLSELSDQFVKHPAEVVEVGQQVRVRVIEVDLKGGRIGLSLRAGAEKKRRPARGRRSDTLKALDDLFKK